LFTYFYIFVSKATTLRKAILYLTMCNVKLTDVTHTLH